MAPGRRFDSLAALAIVAGSLVAWWPVRDAPYSWDGAGFVVEAARDLGASDFWPLVAGHSDFAHPPLFPVLLALTWKVLGSSLVVSHALVLPFFVLLLAATYRLGTLAGGRAVGVAATVVLALTPVALEELGQVYMDLPLAALTTAALVAWRAERAGWTTLLLALAVLTKLPAAVVPSVLLVAEIDARRAAGKRVNRRMIVALVAALLMVPLWLGYHRLSTGWTLSLPGRGSARPQDIEGFLLCLRAAATLIFVAQGRAVVTALALLAAVVVLARRRAPEDRLLVGTLAALPIFAWIAFSLFGELLQRYALFAYPALDVTAFALLRTALGSSASASALARSRRLVAPLAAAAAVASFAEIALLHPRQAREWRYDFRPEEDLGARDFVAAGVEAARWVEAHYPDARVYGSFPESYQLTRPYDGYVTRPHDFAECESWTATTPAVSPAADQLLYMHRYTSGQRACRQLEVITDAQLLQTFEVNGHAIDVRRLSRLPGS